MGHIERQIDRYAEEWGDAARAEDAAAERLEERLDELTELIKVHDELPLEDAYRYAKHLLHGTCNHCHGAGCGECDGDPDRYSPYEVLIMRFSK